MMNQSQSQPEQIGNRQSAIGNPVNRQSAIGNPIDPVWEQLRDSIRRLGEAGQQKTDPVVLARKLAARAKTLQGRLASAETAEATSFFLAFDKGHQRYGIPIGDVVEIVALEQYSPVPKTPPFIPGVIQWRGSILALLDLGALFQIPETGISDIHNCVIVEAGGRRVAVVAGEIAEIVSVAKSQIQTLPQLPGNVSPEWFSGVYDDSRLILRMDLILHDARLVDWRKG